MQTKIKKNVFVERFPQNVLGRLECKFDKTGETVFFKTSFFSLEPEVK